MHRLYYTCYPVRTAAPEHALGDHVATAPPLRTEPHGRLQEFLQRCRRRIGISQEAMAQRLHMSSRGYWNLEQGRIRNPSSDLLDHLASALELQPYERWMLYMLATGHEPPPLDGVPLENPAAWRNLLAAQTCPATIVDRAWRIVSANASYQQLPLDGRHSNLMLQLLLTPHLRDTLLGEWQEAWAVPLLAELRAACELYRGTRWPASLLAAATRDQRVRTVWRNVSAKQLLPSATSRPFLHPVWGPSITMVETVPRYLTGFKIISFVPDHAM
ncbi:helix-turn-helix domain-containing protein [Streptomyces sp. RB6PN25]|uniref:Helix-turn-helix domain-containing protein n=1 Tax=Streptomyces humicola TaxID=2953240 RepID=A0ABT1PSU2_9ACTN|nr:helix-turn-helix domain-containing protein [Streptomyces humicola]MCQ4080751.1 helix-turn-helix domain-containing protein [Streptomyces humicola]